MNSTLPLRKIRDFGEKVSDTVRFIKLNWKNLLIMYGLFVLPFLLLAVYFGAGYFMDIFTQIRGNSLRQLFSGWKLISAAVLIFLAVNIMAASIFLYMDLWERNNRMPTISEVAAGIMRPFLTNILYSFIMSILVVAACLPLIFFVMALGNSPGLMALLIFILFLGILFFSAFFVLVYPANTIGRNEFGSPIRAVWILLKDNWWSSLGYLLVLILIYYVFSMITQLATSLLFGASTLLNPENTPTAGKSMTLVYGFNILLQQVFYIIVFVGAGILYYTLHEEKVGSGLESRIDELGSQQIGQGQEEEY